jgi:hypothetical protein
MSGLASAYTQTFRSAQPLQGAAISNLAESLMGSLVRDSAQLQAGLMNSGLGATARMLDTTLVNQQRTRELEMDIKNQENIRKDSRRAGLTANLLAGAGALASSRASQRSGLLGSLLSGGGDALSRGANRWGTGQTLFQGAQAVNNPAIDALLNAQEGASKTRAPLPSLN